MTNKAGDEETGFKADVDELPEADQGSPDTLEDEALPEDDEPRTGEAHEQAAEERVEGGYR
jgi:ATP phosphoribosyltransferase regulatory subunit HisZ